MTLGIVDDGVLLLKNSLRMFVSQLNSHTVWAPHLKGADTLGQA